MTITTTEYGAFEQAYDYFNRELFGGKLPPCLITLQRKANSLGYYSPQRFRHRSISEYTDEIALNPAKFEGRSDEEILSTLVHEMVHHHQWIYAERKKGRYHNREWADMMISLGLIPSNTGKPGGKQTGYHMAHYIREGGRFQQTCRKLLANGFKLNWQSMEEMPGAKGKGGGGKDGKGLPKKNRDKFTCPKCGLNAWAKPSAFLICGFCYQRGRVLRVMKPYGVIDFEILTDKELASLSLTLEG